MRVAIVGSREYPNPDAVGSFVRALAEKYPDAIVVSGGARGVDQLAERAAGAAGLFVSSIRPTQWKSGRWGYDVLRFFRGQLVKSCYQGPFKNWTSFRDAAMGRNSVIVESSDIVVAFWDGKSRGTKDGVDKAITLGKQLYVYGPNGLLMTRKESS